MYENLWCPVDTKHSYIGVSIYDDKVGFLCYEGDAREGDVGTPTYTIEQTENIIKKIDEALAFKGKNNVDIYVFEESVPLRYLSIEAHTIQKTGRNWFCVCSVINYGDWECIENPIFGVDGLCNLRHHLQLAINKIKQNLQ